MNADEITRSMWSREEISQASLDHVRCKLLDREKTSLSPSNLEKNEDQVGNYPGAEEP